MPELREVFEMTTKQMEPDVDAWRQQEKHQRRSSRNRKIGAFAVAAVVGVAAVVLVFANRTEPSGNRPRGDPSPPARGRGLRGVLGRSPNRGRDSRCPRASSAASLYFTSPDRTMFAYNPLLRLPEPGLRRERRRNRRPRDHAGRGRRIRRPVVSRRLDARLPGTQRRDPRDREPLRRGRGDGRDDADHRPRSRNLRLVVPGSDLRPGRGDDRLPRAAGPGRRRDHAVGPLVGSRRRRRALAPGSGREQGRVRTGRRDDRLPGLAPRLLGLLQAHDRRRRTAAIRACSWRGTRSNTLAGPRTGRGSSTRTATGSTSSTSPPARPRWSPKATLPTGSATTRSSSFRRDGRRSRIPNGPAAEVVAGPSVLRPGGGDHPTIQIVPRYRFAT